MNQLLNAINKRFEIDLKRSDMYVEAACMQAEIAIEEGELKCMVESADDSDYQYMLEAANEGFVGKIREAIKKIIDALKEFFKGIKDKVIKFFSKKETDEAIDKIEKKAKINPLVRNKKVETKDTEAEISLIQKYKAKLKSLASKIKSGNKVDDDEIDEAREGFTKRHAAIIAATATVTVAAAIALLKKRAGKISKDVEASEKDAIDEIEKIDAEIVKIEYPDAARQLQLIAKELSKASQIETNATVSGATSLLSAIKQKLLGNKSQAEADEEDRQKRIKDYTDAFGESADDNFNSEENNEGEEQEPITESTDDDLAAEFAKILGC